MATPSISSTTDGSAVAVRVTSIELSFWNWTVLLVKLALAAIPAVIIVALTVGLFATIFAGVGAGIKSSL